MRNTGLLILLVGVYLVINAGSFRDLIAGKASIGFLNPKNDEEDVDLSTGAAPGRSSNPRNGSVPN